ncbi:MAG: HTH domain-containing protein [Gammaproteobacteria bacterium]|nr:HTH domain-containing protein [Gammaproteobacteria bacterium]
MSNALDQLGQTQQQLIRLLQSRREGLSIDALRSALNVSRNAVRQHLTSLLAQGLVAHGPIVPTGGRPERRFVLTDAAHELFPRRYVELASSLIREIGDSMGEAQLLKLLTRLGDEVGKELGGSLRGSSSADTCRAIAAAMTDLGYDARAEVRGTTREIQAKNCVFHHLAQRHPAVCRFDLAFLARASGQHVEHTECIVRGGDVCRFRFSRGSGSSSKV